MWRLAFHDGAWELLLVALLTLLLHSTRETVRCTQVNFLSLLLLLAFWETRQRAIGGLWLGLAIVVKPVFFLLPVYLLIRRHWATLGGLVATAIATCAFSIAAFGPRMFFSYFTANPVTLDVPDYFYTETVNQSLLATTLRWTQLDLAIHSPYDNPLFWSLAALLTGVTLWVTWRAPAGADDWLLGTWLLLSLLLFPKTLAHYGVLLLLPILLLWAHRHHFPGGAWMVAGLIGLLYISVYAEQATGGMILVWLALAFGSQFVPFGKGIKNNQDQAYVATALA